MGAEEEKKRVTLVNLQPILDALDLLATAAGLAAAQAAIDGITTYLADPINAHLHNDQAVAPMGGGPITLASGGDPWEWGDWSDDFIAAEELSNMVDLHWAILSGADTNADYEVEFGEGETPDSACLAAFSRTSPFTASLALPLMTHKLAAGARVRARLRDSVGGSEVDVKLFYHEYE